MQDTMSQTRLHPTFMCVGNEVMVIFIICQWMTMKGTHDLDICKCFDNSLQVIVCLLKGSEFTSDGSWDFGYKLFTIDRSA